MRMWSPNPSAAAPVPPAPCPADPLPEKGGSRSACTGSIWPEARIVLAARLWGEGFISPGGEAEVLRLAAPLGLSEASSLLLLGCGAGGPARCIAAQLGAWVSGFEAEPNLAAAGADLCSHAGLGRRAQVVPWDAAAPAIGRRSCHHALALEAMRASAPEAVLGALALALRRDAQVTLVETEAVAGTDPADPEMLTWSRLEGRIAPLPGEALITRLLCRLGFEVRVVENISARHIGQAIRSWRDAARAFTTASPSPEEASVLMREAHLWDLRLRLMRSGRIRLVRWHAIRRGMT